MTATAARIVAATSATACRSRARGDEFDRLAAQINAMLDRIAS